METIKRFVKKTPIYAISRIHVMRDKYEIKKSRDAQLKFLSLIKNLFREVNPMPIKFAMNYLGFEVGKCRLPLTDLSEQNKNKITKILDGLK